MITGITFGVLIERVKRYLSNGWPDIADNYTSNEIMLYIYGALADTLAKSSSMSFTLNGIYNTPEGTLTDFSFPASGFTRDPNTGYFKVTLPAPPINIPLGYSIKAPTFVGNASESYPVIWLEAYNRSVSLKMPTPNFGIYSWVKNRILFLSAEGQNLMTSGLTLSIPMMTARSVSGLDTDLINAPDEMIELAFEMTIDTITGRVDRPKILTNMGNTVPTAK